MMHDNWLLSSLFLGVLTLLALAAVVISMMRLSVLNPRRTRPRIVVGTSAKCLANVLTLFAGVDWFYGGHLFRWYLLSGGVLFLAADLLLSLRWVRATLRRQVKRETKECAHGHRKGTGRPGGA